MLRDDYEPIIGDIVEVFTYEEDDDTEQVWADFQNAEYYMYSDSDECGLIDGKKWWLLYPYKQKGVLLTKDNIRQIVKWFVEDSYDFSDYAFEWDFKNHCPIIETIEEK